jgi:hypothetical protein
MQIMKFGEESHIYIVIIFLLLAAFEWTVWLHEVYHIFNKICIEEN